MTATKESKTYEGWKNYETWCVKLWLDNDAETYADMRDLAGNRSVTCSDEEKHDLAQAIKDYVEENLPDLGASLAGDLVNAALAEVDWFEIAEGILAV